MQDTLYAFVMRGELTKIALLNAGVVSKHAASELLAQEYIKSLSLDLLDDEHVNTAKQMSTVYTAIAAFENTVREFVVKILIENRGENWWEKSVSDKIRQKSESRKREEEKVRWHTPRGDSMINYVEFGDLASIMAPQHSHYCLCFLCIKTYEKRLPWQEKHKFSALCLDSSRYIPRFRAFSP